LYEGFVTKLARRSAKYINKSELEHSSLNFTSDIDAGGSRSDSMLSGRIRGRPYMVSIPPRHRVYKSDLSIPHKRSENGRPTITNNILGLVHGSPSKTFRRWQQKRGKCGAYPYQLDLVEKVD